MKKIFTLTAKLAVMLVSLSMMSSCEDFMDRMNEDVNHATNTTANFLIPEIIMSTAQNVVGGDFNTYLGCYNEQWVGTHNQLFNAETRGGEVQLSTTFNNNWGTVYTNIRNAKIVISKCSEGGEEAGDDLTLSIAEIMLAYNAAVLTDMFGDTPFSQTGDYVNYMTPELDSQESIYDTIDDLLDDAITRLKTGPGNTLSSYDFLYGGKSDSWLLFANGLKARYAMRRLKINGTDADLQKIVGYVDASFSDASQQAEFNVYDANNINPTFDFEWSRDGISSSQSMYDKLVAHNDPRVNRAYWHSSSWKKLDKTAVEEYLAPNGKPNQSQYEYAYDFSFFAQTASVMLLSYHELQFIKAEALTRLNKNDDAKAALKKAVVASMANFENSVTAALNAPSVLGYGGIESIPEEYPVISTEAAENYFDTQVVPLYDANPLKETMIQKYFGMWGASGESTETYNDIRRMKAMGQDVYDLANTGKFPLRCPYGTDDTSANPNVQAAYGNGDYVYTEPVWWAGGTR